ncbi:MAG: CDP-archaeol synthase [Dehalococcoidia bacterium]
MFVQRIAVAAVAIPLIVLVVWLGGALFDIVLAAVLALAAIEFFSMVRGSWRQPLALGAGLASAGLVIAADDGYDWLVYALAISALASLALLVIASDVEAGAANWGGFLQATIYCGFLGAHYALLRDADEGRYLVLVALLGTYAVDTLAYFAGKTLGKHPFAPRISPKKTWEGTAAGLIGGIPVVVGLGLLFDLDWTLLDLIGLGLLFPVFAIVGDLAESALKRSLDVKDTSNLIPGHGGIVDRLDSILFTGALVYYWLIWVVD